MIESVSHGGAVRSRPTVTQGDLRGLRVIVVATGRLRASFLPGIGGRLISLESGGRELLWRNPLYLDDALQLIRPREHWPELTPDMSSWANVGGSKTWLAPQGWSGAGEWAGPPDAVLDSGDWDAELIESDEALLVRMTSASDERSGVRMRREFRFGGDPMGFTETVTFTACSDRTVRWAIWEVVQVHTGPPAAERDPQPRFVVETRGSAAPRNLIDGLAPLRFDYLDSRSIGIPVQDRVGKLGFSDATGRFSFRRVDGSGLTLSWPIDDDSEYPDDGSRAEIWMQHPVPAPLSNLGDLMPDAHLSEVEILSPLRTLAPGMSTSLDIHWRVDDAPLAPLGLELP